jgi:tetratricopeptide (TPR) repeat protein
MSAAEELIRLFPFEATAHLVLARGYEWQEKWESALAECQEADKYKLSQATECLRGSIEAGRKNLTVARKVAAALEAYWQSKPLESILLSTLYCRMGDVRKALIILHAGLDRHDGTVLMAPTHPHMDPARSDPEYARFLQRIGLRS